MSDSVSDTYVPAHDPLCMWSTNATPDPLPGYDCGECEVIAKVRKEERSAYEDVKLRAYRKGQQEMLAECIAAVEKLYINDNDPDWDWPIQAATRALRDLEEKS